MGSEGGLARYTYRLRVSSAARTALLGERDRCRWVWNECVAKSRAVHAHNKATSEKATCGPARLDRMLTAARQATSWLRAVRSENQARTAAVRTYLHLHRVRSRVPRDKNSARVMLVRAGLNPAGAEGTGPPGVLLQEAA
jgi:putative transposase